MVVGMGDGIIRLARAIECSWSTGGREHLAAKTELSRVVESSSRGSSPVEAEVPERATWRASRGIDGKRLTTFPRSSFSPRPLLYILP